jgi:DNA-binding transcriptional LysR family regulator
MPKHPAEVRAKHCMAVVVGARDASWQLTHCATGEQSAINAHSAFRTNCPSALIAAAVSGAGVAILPEHIGCIPESRGELVRILSDWRAPSLDTQLLYRARRNQPLRVRKLVDRLVRDLSGSAISQTDSLPAHGLSSFAQFKHSGADARDSLMAA